MGCRRRSCVWRPPPSPYPLPPSEWVERGNFFEARSLQSPSPAQREREGPLRCAAAKRRRARRKIWAKRWEGEGLAPLARASPPPSPARTANAPLERSLIVLAPLPPSEWVERGKNFERSFHRHARPRLRGGRLRRASCRWTLESRFRGNDGGKAVCATASALGPASAARRGRRVWLAT